MSCVQGQITYAYTSLEVDYHCTQLFNKGPQALGFDIEWLVTYKAGQVPRKTALLQLCHRQGKGSYQCYLLHLTHSGVTPALSRLLQSEVWENCWRLLSMLPFLLPLNRAAHSAFIPCDVAVLTLKPMRRGAAYVHVAQAKLLEAITHN